MTDVFFGILGPLLVQDGTPPAPRVVPGAKERLLLGRLLVSSGHAVAVDTLMDDLWDGAPPPSARKSLQAHVVRLRTALEPDRPVGSPGRLVTRRADGYALAVPPDAVDASIVTAAAAAGRAALDAGEPERARDLLGRAEGLWRGEPLADWRDAAWTRAERQRLAAVRTAVLEARLDADLALGRHREVVAELQALAGEEPLHEGWWTRLMLALYRGGRQAEALLAGRRAQAVLAEELGLDAGPALRRMQQDILEQAATLDPAGQQAVARPVDPSAECPYRGLATYQPDDAAVFRGRGAAIRGLVARTAGARLVVVSGPSGAGKSSLIRAGLLPALGRGAVPDSASWPQVVLTPGPRPVDRLAPVLSGGDGRRPVVLVVDQFEEVWTAGAVGGEREAFLDALLEVLDDGLAARVVLAVRGDHLGRLSEHAELAARAGDGMVLVPPLTEAELREVVQEPAAVAGLTVEPDLVDAVVRDVYGQTVALPLLSSALVGSWERRRDGTLTLAGYLEAGGVTGALARTAEDALAGLDGPGRALARRLLVRLAAAEEAGSVVRRRVAVDELAFDGPDGPARRGVVEAFVGRRLLTIDAAHLEVTHEALLTGWPRLAGWLAEDAAGRAVRSHLAPEARDWDVAGRPEDRLYRGARLVAAQDWLAGPDADPSLVERDFVEASTARSQAELAEARAQTARERAGRRRSRRLAAFLAVAALVAAAAGGLAVQRQGVAAANARRADANRLAASSANVPGLDVSLLLAAEAFRTEPTAQTQDGLLAAAVAHHQVARVYRDQGIVRHLALSPDGRTLYGHAEHRVVAWNLDTGAKTVLAEYGGGQLYPADVDTSPSGDVAAVLPPGTSGQSSTVRVIGPDRRTRLNLDRADLGGWPVSLEFTRDGRRLVVEYVWHYGDATVRICYASADLTTGKLRPFRQCTPLVPGAFYLDPWIASLANDAEVVMTFDRAGDLISDAARGVTTRLDTEGRELSGSCFVPVTGGVVEGDVDGAAYWFPLGRAQGRGEKLVGHTGDVCAAATDARQTVLATGGADGRVVVYDRVGVRWVARETFTGHQGPVREIVLSPDGTRMFSTSEDQTVIEVDLGDRRRFGSVIPQFRDPGIPEAHPVVLGQPVVLDDPPTWVIPMITGAWPPEDRAKSYPAAAFIDPVSLQVRDWIHFDAINPRELPNSAAALSPDRRRVAVTGGFTTAVIDVADHSHLTRIRLPERDGRELGYDRPMPEPVTTVAWSRDGARLFLGTGESVVNRGRSGAVAVVDAATGRLLTRVLAGAGVYGLDVSPDGRLLAVGYASGEVRVADTGTYRTVRTMHTQDVVRAVRFSPDGTRLAAGGDGRRLNVWATDTWRTVFAPTYGAGAAVSLTWLPGGRTIAYGGDDGRAVLYDARTGAVRGIPLPIYRDEGRGSAMIAPSDGRRLAVLGGVRPGLAVREGAAYSLVPADWLAWACGVVQRDLTRAEWATYEPAEPWHPTCTDLGPPGPSGHRRGQNQITRLSSK